MNDLDICKRIAKIEGLRVSKDVKPKCGGAYASTHTDKPYGSYNVYNPLTDDALCFQLLVKYFPMLELTEDSGEYIVNVIDLDAMSPQNLLCRVRDGSLNRAICLAIIEVNEGE